MDTTDTALTKTTSSMELSSALSPLALLGIIRRHVKTVAGALIVSVFATVAHAGCTCQCVNGSMQPLCSSTLDLPPMCMGICGPAMPSMEMAPLELPPLGTRSCRPAQVCDTFGNCRTQNVCR